MWEENVNFSSNVKPKILGVGLYFNDFLFRLILMLSFIMPVLEKTQYSVFSIFMFILHFLVHLCIDYRSFCISASRDVGSFPVIQIFPSSANLILSDFVWENMSLMNTLNRIGEITDPFRCPIPVWNQFPVNLLTTQWASLWLRNVFIQVHNLPLTPTWANFTNKPSLHTLSKAFSRSMKTATVLSFWLNPLNIDYKCKQCIGCWTKVSESLLFFI